MWLKQIYTQHTRHVCRISEVESRRYLRCNSNTDLPSNCLVQQPTCPQNLCLSIFLLTLHLSLLLHLALFSHIKRKAYTIVQCKQVASVIDCDYSEQTDVTEKIIILITILVIPKNGCLELKELCTCLQYIQHITEYWYVLHPSTQIFSKLGLKAVEMWRGTKHILKFHTCKVGVFKLRKDIEKQKSALSHFHPRDRTLQYSGYNTLLYTNRDLQITCKIWWQPKLEAEWIAN
jgi:hypothetical protein